MYLNCFGTTKEYLVTYRYFCGEQPKSLYTQFPEYSWRVRQLTQDPDCSSLSYWMHQISRVARTRDPEFLVHINSKVERWGKNVLHENVHAPQSYCTSQTLVDAKAATIGCLRRIVNWYTTSCSAYFPACVPMHIIRASLLGKRTESIFSTIEKCQRLHAQFGEIYTGLPAWALEYAISDKQLMELFFWNNEETVSWGYDYTLLEAAHCEVTPDSLNIIVDGQNVGPSQFDFFLSQELKLVGADSDALRFIDVYVVDDESKERIWDLVDSRAPRFHFQKCLRTVNNKSGADFDLVGIVAKLYANGVRNFLFFSSDADFSRLPAMYSDAQFTFVCQRAQTSRLWMQEMDKQGIKYFLTDESFSTWNKKAYLTELVKISCVDCSDSILLNRTAWNNYVKGKQLPCGIASAKAREVLCNERNLKLYQEDVV